MSKLRLFVVHGSHPCAIVQRALEIKGLDHAVVEWPPLLHAPLQWLLFGARTVPGLQLEGERLSGSRRILRRLEELEPEPPLYPADPDQRAQVEEAERWGDKVLQPIARRLMWPAIRRRPDAAPSYSAGSRLPMPDRMLVLSAPLVARGEMALNKASDEAARADLRDLPAHLDRIDAWIEDGTLGGEQPTAADLQVAATLRLLMTLGDVRPLIESRPAGELALRLFSPAEGEMPAGVFEAEWIPASVPTSV